MVAAAILIAKNSNAQYPRYFSYDDENGLPSSEVYSIVQDFDGSIWMGLDAGLYRFDGVRYHFYRSESQKSKSISGLTISASGKLYCYNFLTQLFVLENDSLKELKHPTGRITGLSSDKNGNIIVTHWQGISIYNEESNTWKDYHHIEEDKPIYDRLKTAICTKGSLLDTIGFVNAAGWGRICNGEIEQQKSDIFFLNSPDYYIMQYAKGGMWISSKEKNHIYRTTGNSIQKLNDPSLLALLNNRKITGINTLPDGKLWICTYKGVVAYDLKSNKSELYYPEFSFSDCFIDREGNYWFSTLQAGLLRIPNWNFIVWDQLDNNRLARLSTDGEQIYFATVNGTIGQLNVGNHAVKTFHTAQDADVQSLDYDESKEALLFSINGRLLELKDSIVRETGSTDQAIKSQLYVNGDYFKATSHGTFVNEIRLSEHWARIIKKGNNGSVWVATNQGLILFNKINGNWSVEKTLLNNTQIVSIEYDSSSQQLFVIDYMGNVYVVSPQNELKPITSISSVIKPNRIAYYAQKIFIATNDGIKIFDLVTQTHSSLNLLSGLISDNIQDLVIVNEEIWLASSKGLQRIGIDALHAVTPLAKINLRNQQHLLSFIKLNNNEQLILHPEVSIYKSNGDFEYAYRINNGSEWVKLPSTVEQIELHNLSWGDFTIELKAIDHLGRDSANTIVLTGYNKPPFWKTWWFMVLIAFVFAFIVIYTANLIVRNIKKREREKAELVKSQLTALKAQMNPHFMYNTLNSIQALILTQDIKNSNLYLSKFSNLMRKVLDASGKEEISLTEESEILELYLSLEKLRFGNEFNYTITKDDTLSSEVIMLPPLILQPFAENALKHGLLHKKGIKTLNIRFDKSDYLHCTLTDNGIGRKRAAEIKERQQEKFKSFSMNATQMRVNLLNRFRDKKFEVIINDLYKDNRACGTEVHIRIPLN